MVGFELSNVNFGSPTDIGLSAVSLDMLTTESRRGGIRSFIRSSFLASSKLPILSLNCSRAMGEEGGEGEGEREKRERERGRGERESSMQSYTHKHCTPPRIVNISCMYAHVSLPLHYLHNNQRDIPVLSPVLPSDSTPTGSWPDGVRPFNANTFSRSSLQDKAVWLKLIQSLSLSLSLPPLSLSIPFVPSPQHSEHPRHLSHGSDLIPDDILPLFDTGCLFRAGWYLEVIIISQFILISLQTQHIHKHLSHCNKSDYVVHDNGTCKNLIINYFEACNLKSVAVTCIYPSDDSFNPKI